VPTVTVVAALLTIVLLGGAYGVFFAYSNSVVPGLDRIAAERAVDAMRRMNVVIVNPLFLATFIGPVITGAATGFLLLGLDENTPALLFFVSAAVYLLGGIGITGRLNIPLNNALNNALDNDASTDFDARWAAFSPTWRRWNSVRAFLSVVALVLSGVGLHLWGN
jgi:uncharacterized membrane protein